MPEAGLFALLVRERKLRLHESKQTNLPLCNNHSASFFSLAGKLLCETCYDFQTKLPSDPDDQKVPFMIKNNGNFDAIYLHDMDNLEIFYDGEPIGNFKQSQIQEFRDFLNFLLSD